MSNLPKILIVDDKIENLVALEKLLSVFKIETIRALSGNEALKQTLNHKFALARGCRGTSVNHLRKQTWNQY